MKRLQIVFRLSSLASYKACTLFPNVFVENHARFVDVLLADVYPPPFYTRDLSHDEVILYIYIYVKISCLAMDISRSKEIHIYDII